MPTRLLVLWYKSGTVSVGVAGDWEHKLAPKNDPLRLGRTYAAEARRADWTEHKGTCSTMFLIPPEADIEALFGVPDRWLANPQAAVVESDPEVRKV